MKRLSQLLHWPNVFDWIIIYQGIYIYNILGDIKFKKQSSKLYPTIKVKTKIKNKIKGNITYKRKE